MTPLSAFSAAFKEFMEAYEHDWEAYENDMDWHSKHCTPAWLETTMALIGSLVRPNNRTPFTTSMAFTAIHRYLVSVGLRTVAMNCPTAMVTTRSHGKRLITSTVLGYAQTGNTFRIANRTSTS